MALSPATIQPFFDPIRRNAETRSHRDWWRSEVAKLRLWRTDDLGASWRKLAAHDQEQIRNRLHQNVFDPAEPQRFWISGCYGASPFITTDVGKTFQRLGNLSHMDGIGVVKSADQGRTWQ